jgi:ribose transport system substrate-binding protein
MDDKRSFRPMRRVPPVNEQAQGNLQEEWMLRSISALNTIAAAAMALSAWATTAQAADATKVALVPGGPHPYFAAWEKAGQDAMKDFNLGAADYRVPQKWELSLQNSLLESLLSQGYNAFLVFPGDPVGSNSTVQELTENGAPVIATAGCLKEPTTASFCFGTDTGNSAYLGTKELIKAMGGKGRIAHFTGFLVDPNTQLRMDAVEKAAKETNGAVSVVQVIADIDAPEPAEEKISAYLAAHAGDVDGIVTTAWVPAVVSANALRKIGDKRIKMVGIDHDEVVLKAIKDGYVDGTMLQNPYGQGFIGSYALDKLRHGCKVKADAPFKTITLTNRFIDSGTVYADKNAVDDYVASMQAITKKIFADFEKTYLTCS